jgi:hypothetical protein
MYDLTCSVEKYKCVGSLRIYKSTVWNTDKPHSKSAVSEEGNVMSLQKLQTCLMIWMILEAKQKKNN